MAGRIPQYFIDDLLSRVDIVDVVDQYVPLKKAGKNHKACCPFHDEKSPSFTVSEEKQFFHCFGCGANGSAIGFLMDYLHISFVEAIEELASRQGLEIPREEGYSPSQQDNLSELSEVMEMVFRLYQKHLREHPDKELAVDYLNKQRGISGETAKEYELGFSPKGWDTLIKTLGGSEESLKRLEKIGVILPSDRGGFYDRFRERIMYPIRDQRGRAIGLGGRVVGDGTPKYLNSPETPLFHKGKELYGLFQAKKHIKNTDTIYVVEGYMDVIALAEKGVRNAVATLGTAPTKEHMEKLFRIIGNITFCFDGDSAGRGAAKRAMEIALPLINDTKTISFMFMPEGEDPDSLVNQSGGKEIFTKGKLQKPLMEYILEVVSDGQPLDLPENRAKVTTLAKPIFEELQDSNFRQMLAEEMAIKCDVDEETFGGVARKNHTKKLIKQVASPGSRGNMLRTAIRILLRQPKFALELNVSETKQTILVNGADFLYELIELIHLNPNISFAGIIEHWRGSKYEKRLIELSPTDSEYGGEDSLLNEQNQLKEEFDDAIQKLKEASERYYIKEVGEMSDDAKQKVRQRMEQLKSIKK